MAIKASEIAGFLNRLLLGMDVSITNVRSINNPGPNSLFFVKKYTPQLCDTLNANQNILVLAVPEYEGKLTVSHIITDKPRYDFARVLEHFFSPPAPKNGVSPTAIVASSVVLGANVTVGHFSVIGENVEIGNDTEIRDHVVIRDSCKIGRKCLIKSNTVIGEEGFGFEFAEDGTPIRVPHLGSVIIGDEVEIGAMGIIARGTLDNTVISDHVKVDDHVFIAHNVFVGENTVIIAGAEVSGSVHIGKNVWVGPQVSIINGVEIGDNTLIGIGTVVIKSLDANLVVAGNPAKVLHSKFE
jgi:UDP-3-O-[3-hydroxymyristoyl] glucosamine N-acyltransferase